MFAHFVVDQARSISGVAMSSTRQNQIVEHVALFKLKEDGTTSGKINSMINGLNELVTLDQVVHLFSGPIYQLRSTSTFTHVLHSCYRSKEDLNAYAIHPDHVCIVKEAESIREHVMAPDWIPDQVPGKIRDYLDATIDVEFVVPSSSQTF